MSPIVTVGVASVMAAGLVTALVALLAAPAPRVPATPATAASHQSLRIADASDTTGLVKLGDLGVGVDGSSVSIDVTGPNGPQIDPNIAVGVEPGGAGDAIVVPLVKELTNATGQVAVHTPAIATIKPIGINVGAEGKITATVHQFEGLP